MAESTILMVDDEAEIIQLMSMYFNNEGYKLLQASNGLEALKLLQSQLESNDAQDGRVSSLYEYTRNEFYTHHHALG